VTVASAQPNPEPSAHQRAWTPDARDKMSEKIAALWQDEAYKAETCARMRSGWKRRGGLTADERARIAETVRRKWRDPAFKASVGRMMSIGWQNRRDRLAARAAEESSGVRT